MQYCYLIYEKKIIGKMCGPENEESKKMADWG